MFKNLHYSFTVTNKERRYIPTTTSYLLLDRKKKHINTVLTAKCKLFVNLHQLNIINAYFFRKDITHKRSNDYCMLYIILIRCFNVINVCMKYLYNPYIYCMHKFQI